MKHVSCLPTTIFLGISLIVSCGTAGTGTTTPITEPTKSPASPPTQTPSTPTSFLVDTAAQLPTCDSSRGGNLVYVKGETKFYTCSGTTWEVIAIQGPKGDAGTTPNATKVSSAILCNGALSGTPLYFGYQARLFSSGDLFITGQISTASMDINNSTFYSSTQVGANTGGITLGFDLMGASNGGWWSMSLDRTSLIVTIENHDDDIANSTHLNTWTMTPDKCTVQSY